MKESGRSKIEKGIKSPEVKREKIEFDKKTLEEMAVIKSEAREDLEKAREELKNKYELEKIKEKKGTKEKFKEVFIKILSIPQGFKKLIGSDSEEAWAEREEMQNPINIAKSLAGVASQMSRDWLDQNKENKILWPAINRGLAGDDHPDAWEIRNWLEKDGDRKKLRGGRWARLIKFLGLHKSELFYALREKINKFWLAFWQGLYTIGDLLMSTAGLELDKSKKARELIEKYKHLAPAEALLRSAGDESETAKKLRKEFERDPKLKWAYEKSLIGTEQEKNNEKS